MGGVGSFGGMLFNLIIAASLSHYGTYTPVFVMAGLMHPFQAPLSPLTARISSPHCWPGCP